MHKSAYPQKEFSPEELETLRAKRRVRRIISILVLCALLVIAAMAGLFAGSYALSLADIQAVFAKRLFGSASVDVPKVAEVVIWQIRMPRLILAAVSGMALAVAGVAYQGCFRNPLVEPFILGASSGAACGAALSMLFPLLFAQTQLTAFAFALGGVALSSWLARSRGHTPPVSLVLSGIIVGALFMAAVGIMKYLANDAELREITFWMLGGFHHAGWSDAFAVSALTFPSALVIWALAWKLNLLALGDDESRSLGVNPSQLRRILLFFATLAAASCVASAGIIAWVGLMAPHAARLLFGADHRWLVPASGLLGATYLLFCDYLARTLTGAEIPIGILSATVGAPFLLWLIRVKGRELYVE
ncbi:iron ABC transporter permease [Desulfovibrio sp. OttesenSCG-928-I05]|nr:iron ABC transporter permease [Desulfovibrio sp. OttesenSCG-928-I05]